MWRALGRYQLPIAFAVALLLPAGIYRAQVRGRDGGANGLDRAVLAVTAPIQQLLVGSVGAVSDAWHHYVDLTDARAVEGELRRALGEERRRVAALEVLEVENEHLRALLDLELRNPVHRFQAARVIGAGIDPGVDVVRVDRGALHGLGRGFPVLSGNGLVGRVLEVGWTSADVQLVADRRVSVPAQILRTGARGRLRGTGDALDFGLELSEVLRSDDVREGDRVVTSGLGGIYPPGIPIGVVTRLFNREGVPHRFADVVPFADFARLSMVEVLIRATPGQPLVTPEPLLPPALRARPDATDSRFDPGPWPPPPPPRPDAGASRDGGGPD